MLGLCYIEMGNVADAIAQFKKGLYAGQKTESQELTLLYELGAAYELLSDRSEALYYFQKVHARDPEFRDVAERVVRLQERLSKSRSGGSSSSGSSGAPAQVAVSVPDEDDGSG
jgi:tetratricopeptide (TPR) repeat protein